MRKPSFARHYAGCRTQRAGVFLRIHRPIERASGERSLRRYFVARIVYAGRTHYRYFSISTLGRREAWQGAVNCRVRWEAAVSRLSEQTADTRNDAVRAYHRNYYLENNGSGRAHAYYVANREKRNAQIAAAARARRAARRAA